MTLNVLWSDAEGAYALADSARTHFGVPQHAQSLLGQSQRLIGAAFSVEEGVQKLVPVDQVLLSLCGAEVDVVGFANRFHASVASKNMTGVFEFMSNLPGDAKFEIGMAVAGDDPPFRVMVHPAKELRTVARGEIYMSGSLSEPAKNFLGPAIRKYSVGAQKLSAEFRLVVSLAWATTMAAHFNLTECSVGGAFFGCRLDADAVHWQPDIAYVMYHPNIAEIAAPPDAKVVTVTPVVDMDITTTRVREHVCVAASTNASRAVASYAPMLVPDIDGWSSRWKESLSSLESFARADYVVFVPKVHGPVIIAANDQTWFALRHGCVDVSREFLSLIASLPRNEFSCRVLLARSLS